MAATWTSRSSNSPFAALTLVQGNGLHASTVNSTAFLEQIANLIGPLPVNSSVLGEVLELYRSITRLVRLPSHKRVLLSHTDHSTPAMRRLAWHQSEQPSTQ